MDFAIFYDLILEINTRDDWMFEGPHVLRASVFFNPAFVRQEVIYIIIN